MGLLLLDKIALTSAFVGFIIAIIGGIGYWISDRADFGETVFSIFSIIVLIGLICIILPLVYFIVYHFIIATIVYIWS